MKNSWRRFDQRYPGLRVAENAYLPTYRFVSYALSVSRCSLYPPGSAAVRSRNAHARHVPSCSVNNKTAYCASYYAFPVLIGVHYNDKGERVRLFFCCRVHVSRSFPHGESLKFSVSVGVMLSAVGHLRRIVDASAYVNFSKFWVQRSSRLPSPLPNIEDRFFGAANVFSTFALYTIVLRVAASIIRRPLICKSSYREMCIASKGV